VVNVAERGSSKSAKLMLVETILLLLSTVRENSILVTIAFLFKPLDCSSPPPSEMSIHQQKCQ
jgi:hypothetical protein